jgi:lambda family phage portal protein
VFERLRKSVAKAIAPPRQKRQRTEKTVASRAPAVRMYQAAKVSRLTSGWATSTTSADSEMISSLVNLRNRSRALVRDAAYAKRAKVIVQNNVIGSGIGMQAQVMATRGQLRESVNDDIEEAWLEWCKASYCHTGGTLCFADFERALMAQIFEAGEVFVRKHLRSFGGSKIPFALELIEPERIADEFMSPVPPGPAADGAMVKMGIEVDRYGRPIAYWIRSRHPGELRFIQGETDKIERVPADQIVHLRMPIDRWPQTRGEPWMHAVARKLNDMDGYAEAEIIAARSNASSVFTIETPDETSPVAGTTSEETGEKEFTVEPGSGMRLAPGEKFESHVPTRPNTALDPFMRYMLREIAAGTGPSYESISRDYSQSNFSSSQIAVYEDRDLWRIIQQCFIRSFREPLHAEWLQQAVLSESIPALRVEEYAVEPRKFEAATFKPRGWGWVRPREDVPAMIEAHKAGFLPLGDIIAMTCNGKDFWDVMTQIKQERKLMEELGLEFTTSPSVFVAAETKGSGDPPKTAGDGEPPGEEPEAANETAPLRAVSFSGR